MLIEVTEAEQNIVHNQGLFKCFFKVYIPHMKANFTFMLESSLKVQSQLSADV